MIEPTFLYSGAELARLLPDCVARMRAQLEALQVEYNALPAAARDAATKQLDITKAVRADESTARRLLVEIAKRADELANTEVWLYESRRTPNATWQLDHLQVRRLLGPRLRESLDQAQA